MIYFNKAWIILYYGLESFVFRAEHPSIKVFFCHFGHKLQSSNSWKPLLKWLPASMWLIVLVFLLFSIKTELDPHFAAPDWVHMCKQNLNGLFRTISWGYTVIAGWLLAFTAGDSSLNGINMASRASSHFPFFSNSICLARVKTFFEWAN